MLLYLVNPQNRLIGLSLNRSSYWNRFRLWKPLGLLVLAGLTPSDWNTVILDENLAPVDYEALPKPDLVGITAFTSQAPRAYEIAAGFRARGVPVVMGGIHATMCLSEAEGFVDSVVTGEAEPVWADVLQDARAHRLKARYEGGRATMEQIVPARHDLLPEGYVFGSIQTTRGCSLNCPFCSVTRFNGSTYRQRPVADVVEEFKSIPEDKILIVDDNLIGRKPEHIERAKDLFRALAQANTGKSWIGQTTINIADDEELLELAARAGCIGLFVGFESVTPEGLHEMGQKSAMMSGRDMRGSVERIQRHNILVVGSFIMGLDSDRPGVGKLIAKTAERYGVDNMNVLFLTPLPGTRLWKQMCKEERIARDSFPDDWRYYTLTYPVAHYKHLSLGQIVREMGECNSTFYSIPKILERLARRVLAGRNPLYAVVSNLTSRRNSRLFIRAYGTLGQDGLSADNPDTHEPGLDLTSRHSIMEQLGGLVASLMLQVGRFFRPS